MFKRLCGASAGILAVMFAAQAVPQALPPVSAERLQLARQLFEVNGMSAESVKGVERMLGSTVPGAPGRAMTDQIFQRRMPELIRIYESVYAEAYSATELRELIAFYRTPLGRTMVEKGPEIARESMKRSVPLIMAMSSEAASTSCKPPNCTRCTGSNCTPPPLMIKPAR